MDPKKSDSTHETAEGSAIRAERERRLVAAHTMVHDVRSPLTSLVGYIGLIARATRESRDDSANGYVEHASQAGQAIARLLNDYDELCALETELRVPTRSALAVGDLLGKALNRLDGGVGERVACGPPLEACVLCDAELVSRVIENCARYLIIHSDEDAPITLAAERRDHVIRISIADGSRPTGAHDALGPAGWPDLRGLPMLLARAVLDAHGAARGIVGDPGHGGTLWFELSAASVAA